MLRLFQPCHRLHASHFRVPVAPKCWRSYSPTGGPPRHAGREGIAQAVRVDRAPRLDGTLYDPLWQSAKPITDFRQREPHEGEASTEKTEVRILYTKHAVYFGIYCHDSDPLGSSQRSSGAISIKTSMIISKPDRFEP